MFEHLVVYNINVYKNCRTIISSIQIVYLSKTSLTLVSVMNFRIDNSENWEIWSKEKLNYSNDDIFDDR